MNRKAYLMTSIFLLVVIILSLSWKLTLNDDYAIFFELRLPRLLLTLIVGACLSLCGLIFQSLFQNELASPYILGISSGASFFVSLALKFNLVLSIFLFDTLFVFAFLGALVSTFVVYLVSAYLRAFDPRTLLLSGIAQSMFFMSGVFLLQYLSNEQELGQILKWSFGSLDVVGFESFYRIFPLLIFSLVCFYRSSSSLNLLLFGDDFSKAQGLETDRFRLKMFFLTSLVVAFCVAEVGPIGFVGLVVPHLSYKILKTKRYQELVFYTPFLGGALLSFFDFLSNHLLASPVPIGIITSFVGGPFFFFLLLKRS